ncbi:hypothetical protein TNCV_1993331 [Trichonephila clavipes]|nr:hypothetical protein TNCV_1993331 [Trichonephila clavipes]
MYVWGSTKMPIHSCMTRNSQLRLKGFKHVLMCGKQNHFGRLVWQVRGKMLPIPLIDVKSFGLPLVPALSSTSSSDCYYGLRGVVRE